MDANDIINKLILNQHVFQGLLQNVEASEYLWKPSDKKWCILEIVCHLIDEEKEDFRARVKKVLENPESSLPKIDPVSWVHDRNYIQQDYTAKVEEFMDERGKSIQWLTTLENPNWKNTYLHPKLGPLTALHFLINWLAHDYLHIKQIIQLQYGFLQQQTGNDLSYAGIWK